MLISLSDVTKYYGSDLILKKINVKIEPGERIGLIGANGAGKTTLLRILYGDLGFDEGDRAISGSTRVGFLRQNSGLDFKNSITAEMRSVFAEALAAIDKLPELHAQLEAVPYEGERYHELAAEISKLEAVIAAGDGYQVDVKIAQVLAGMGFSGYNLDLPTAQLSGGEKTRLAICKLLLEAPDLLILDEPTNHLDFATLLWLEGYLKSYKGSLLIVSHDRYFLDALCTGMWELDRTRLMQYPGNYTKYLSLRDEYETRQWKLYNAQQEEIARLQDYVDRNLVRATTSKSAKSKRKAIEHMELVDRPNPPLKKVKMRFEYDAEPVKDVLAVQGLTLNAGAQPDGRELFSDFDLHVTRGEKIAIIGENGVGKTSLIKALCARFTPTRGHIEWGRGVKVAYYEQDVSGIDGGGSVLDLMWDRFPRSTDNELRSLLGAYLFSGEDVYKSVRSLSGGEKSKLKFAMLERERANILLLDEPTNHLDLDSKEALDKALQNYTGTLIMVSHDRYLLNKVPDKIIEMGAQGTRMYKGGYESYLEQSERAGAAAAYAAKPRGAASQRGEPPEQGDSSYHRSKQERARQVRLRQEVTELEAEIERLEVEHTALTDRLADPDVLTDYLQLQDVMEQHAQVQAQLALAYERWEQICAE